MATRSGERRILGIGRKDRSSCGKYEFPCKLEPDGVPILSATSLY